MSDYTVNVAASQNGFSAEAIAASSEDETDSVDHVHKRLVLFSSRFHQNSMQMFVAILQI